MIYDRVEYLYTGGSFGKRKTDSMAAARKKKCGKYEFSDNAKKRFKRACNNISLLCRRRIKLNPFTGQYQPHEASFITLTIPHPKALDGKEAMEKLFTPFFEFLVNTVRTSRGKGITHYVWKLERQKREQLHCHIFTPDIVHLGQCLKKWNSLMARNGYLDHYAKKYGNHFPKNSVDITGFSSERLAMYLTKELAKKEQNPVGLTCKVWGCSKGLEMPYFTVEMTTDHKKRMERYRERQMLKVKSDERWSLGIFHKGIDAPKEVLSEDEFKEFITRIRVMGGVVEVVDPIPILVDIPEMTAPAALDLLEISIEAPQANPPPPSWVALEFGF